MPNKIERISLPVGPVAITASSSTTARFGFAAHAGGTLFVTGVTGTPSTLTWFVASGPEATLVPLQDGAGSAVTTTIASSNSYQNAYPIPDAAFGSPFVAAVCNSGSVTALVNLKG